MSNHPYIGLTGTARMYPRSGDNAGCNDYHGTIVAVGQGGSLVEEGGGGATVSAIILRDSPDNGLTHGECDIYFVVLDDPAEARRRLESARAAPVVDYKAIGRGIVDGFMDRIRTGLGYHSDAEAVVKMACESIGRGIASARGGAS